MITKLSPKIPFTLDEDNDLISNLDSISNLKQNIRMIILTNPGEKLMDEDFGLGIRRYLFELENGVAEITNEDDEKNIRINDTLENDISKELRRQCQIYIDYLDITKIEYKYDSNSLEMYIEFIYNASYEDNITITVKA